MFYLHVPSLAVYGYSDSVVIPKSEAYAAASYGQAPLHPSQPNPIDPQQSTRFYSERDTFWLWKIR